MTTTPRTARPKAALPAELTSFVGRRTDLVAVRQLFAATRLVTLTGIGGVGKTRLALQAASQLCHAFPDGVFHVELASLKDPDLLPHTVTDALGLCEQPTAAPTSALLEFASSRRVLLVMDNCEHLVAATADLVATLLRAAPAAHVLATSRQALRIAGEHIYPVTPLLVPTPGDPLEPGTATRYPSVALLADRSAAVVPGFKVTPENEPAMVRLCHRLEGIPLAIELASARLRILTVEDLSARLDDRFSLLCGGSRNLPERHRTLQAVIDWSYDLCTPVEQVLWTRCAVFAGSFTIDAVEAVCTDDILPAAEVLDAVAGLVEKSVLTREEHGHHVRFRMLETLREYGMVRLADSGDEETTARRHRDWYAQLMKTAEDEWASPAQQEWALRLQLEHANLRQALEYCMSRPGEARTGLYLAAAPWFWGAMDHLAEAQLWLARGLALDHEPSRERAWALATGAYMASFRGDQETLDAWSEQARDLALELGDLPSLAFTSHVLAFRRSVGPRAQVADSIPLFNGAIEQYAKSKVPAQYTDSLLSELAPAYVMLNDFDRAEKVVETLYQRCSSAGESWNLSHALWLRAMLALMRGKPEHAQRDLFEALRVKRLFRDTLGLALTLEVLAWTAADREPERAAVLFGTADRLWRTVGARLLRALRTRYHSMARDRLGTARFTAAHSRGCGFTVAEALAFALRESAPEPACAEDRDPAPVRLTRREREVADLVAEGLSNREIAERLFISQRTAEGHVDRILTKLGFNKRTQIATWLLHQSLSAS